MKVLHVIPSVGLRDGGPSVAVRSMTRGLAALGADVTVASTNANGPETLRVPTDRPVVEERVTYRYFPVTGGGKWKLSRLLTEWLMRHMREFDVVHVHALFSFATLAGCRIAKRARVPYVLRPLGTLDPWCLNHRGWKKRPYLQVIEKDHLSHAAAIHVTSDFEASHVAALRCNENIRVIPLGVDISETVDAPALQCRPMQLLFLSRLHPVKGLSVLLDAIGWLHEHHPGSVNLVIAGEGTAEYVAELRTQINMLRVGQYVRFVGFVEGSAKEALLRSSDAFVLPSHHENFGVAVAEAMAVGLPVIVSDQVGIANVVKAYAAGIVVQCSPKALAKAIVQMSHDSETRSRMGRNALQAAKQNFSWSDICRSLLRLYGEVTELPLGDDREFTLSCF